MNEEKIMEWYHGLKRLSDAPFDQYASRCTYCEQCKPEEEWRPIKDCCPHLNAIQIHISKFPKEQ